MCFREKEKKAADKEVPGKKEIREGTNISCFGPVHFVNTIRFLGLDAEYTVKCVHLELREEIRKLCWE
jgi:hypothetical protein